MGPCRLASLTVVRPAFGLPPAARSELLTRAWASSAGWAPGLTTERIGSGLGCPESGSAIKRYIRPITKHVHRRVQRILARGITWRAPARCNNELQGLVSR